MSEQTHLTYRPAHLTSWAILGWGLIICASGALAAQIQVSQTFLSPVSSEKLAPLVANVTESKVLAKSGTTTKPEWSDLTSTQKIALKPLFDNWQYLGDTSKRKWIALSINFQSMTPAEQLKLHARMNEWVALSQQDRRQARLNFAQSKQLPSSHRAATWEAYQALSSEEKARLAQIEQAKKITLFSTQKGGHKTKLATSPIKTPTTKPTQPLVSAHLMLDSRTLLLRSQMLENAATKQ